MNKKFVEQLLEFEITEDKLKMEISLENLEFAFNNAEGNYNDKGERYGAKIKDNKRQEFAEFVVKFLMDDESTDSNNVNWSVPFEKAFDAIFEGAEDDIVDYL